MSNSAALKKLLSKERFVEIEGEKFALGVPDPDTLAEIRALQLKLGVHSGGELTEEFLATASEFGVACVMGCTGLSRDDALQLIMISGGDNSALARECQELCGAVRPSEADMAELNPTS